MTAPAHSNPRSLAQLVEGALVWLEESTGGQSERRFVRFGLADTLCPAAAATSLENTCFLRSRPCWQRSFCTVQHGTWRWGSFRRLQTRRQRVCKRGERGRVVAAGVLDQHRPALLPGATLAQHSRWAHPCSPHTRRVRFMVRLWHGARRHRGLAAAAMQPALGPSKQTQRARARLLSMPASTSPSRRTS